MIKLNIRSGKSTTSTPKVSPKAVQAKKQKEMCRKYPDTYVDCIPKKELQLNESTKIVFSVRRKDDDLGLPYVDIRIFINSEEYVGPTKKGVNFALERLDEFQDIIEAINQECDEKGVY